jgi:hypothetical protein
LAVLWLSRPGALTIAKPSAEIIAAVVQHWHMPEHVSVKPTAANEITAILMAHRPDLCTDALSVRTDTDHQALPATAEGDRAASTTAPTLTPISTAAGVEKTLTPSVVLPWDGVPTAAGGVAMVITLVQRLAAPTCSDTTLRAVLWRLLRQTGARPHDPALAWIDHHRDADASTLLPTIRRWLRHHDRAWRSAGDSTGEEPLSLRRLVRRPGVLRVSATHLDITLPLAHADIRVRRLGLDLDPGWVPWLGRVVAIHYQDLPWAGSLTRDRSS